MDIITLNRATAIRAPATRERPHKKNIGTATIAVNFLVSDCGAVDLSIGGLDVCMLLLQSLEHGVEILLDDGSISRDLQLFHMVAKWALKLLDTNPEFEISPALTARKDSSLTIVDDP